MSQLSVLREAKTLGDLAGLLSFQPKALSYILYKQPAETKYTTFQIPKRGGGYRTIKAPADALKLVQRRLSDLLQDCAAEITAATGRKDRAAHGFKRQRSIVTNARRHRHRRYVFNIDLEDFFPSINLGRVRGFFIKNRDFALHQRVATVIAQIACHDNSLPQGSPCSPVISNLVGHMLDMRLIELASSAGCTYSRYADDITFSTNRSEFPTQIAIQLPTAGVGPHRWLPGEPLRRQIERTGFHINGSKTRMMYRRSRQAVTGLVVNQKINVRTEYRRTVRAMVHQLITTGAFDAYHAVGAGDSSSLAKRPGSLDELHGMLGFIDTLDVYNNESASKVFSSTERVYRNFLLYRNFLAATMPVNLCEGETDNVYLTHAIRSLAANFPQLAEITNGKIRLKVRLYKYPRSSTARILQLNDGGSAVLAKFIGQYEQHTSHFLAPPQLQPVVILYDNDSGAANIQNTIKQVAKITVTGAEPYVHVVRNLYALAVPLVSGATESMIEDCFDAPAKAITIDGKSFNDAKGIDTATQYGKKVFAHWVVRPRADTINFAGFTPLLTNLAALIDAHNIAVAAGSAP